MVKLLYAQIYGICTLFVWPHKNEIINKEKMAVRDTYSYVKFDYKSRTCGRNIFVFDTIR